MSPRASLNFVADFVLNNRRVILVAIALMTAGAMSADAYRKVTDVPVALEHHNALTILKEDSMLLELRRVRRLEQLQVCFHVAQLRHSDWQACLLKETPE